MNKCNLSKMQATTWHAVVPQEMVCQLIDADCDQLIGMPSWQCRD